MVRQGVVPGVTLVRRTGYEAMKKEHFKSILFRNRALAVVVLLVLFGGHARGHDLRVSWTTAILRPDSCELLVRMHAESVVALIQEEAPGATFEPENFESLRPALNSFAGSLYELRAGGGRLGRAGRT